MNGRSDQTFQTTLAKYTYIIRNNVIKYIVVILHNSSKAYILECHIISASECCHDVLINFTFSRQVKSNNDTTKEAIY